MSRSEFSLRPTTAPAPSSPASRPSPSSTSPDRRTGPAPPTGAGRYRGRPAPASCGSAGTRRHRRLHLPGTGTRRCEPRQGHRHPRIHRSDASRTNRRHIRLTDHQKASVIAHELGHVHTGHVDSSPQEYRRHRGQMEPRPEPLLHHLPQTGTRPRQVRRGRSSGPRPEASPTASTGGSARRVDREQTHAIRQWPKENGYEVSELGRTSKAVADAFAAAH